MSEEKWSKSILLSGGVLIFLTIFIYIVGCRNIIKIPMVLLSFFFVILAEVVTLFVVTRTRKDALRISVITASVLYLISTIILALVFVNFLMFFLTLYIILNVILIGITVVVAINLNVFANHVDKKNNKILAAEGIMIDCQSKVESYLNDSEYKEYYEQLNKIYEDIKYSDISSECGMEGSLLKKIEDISENKETLSEYLKDISFLIKERNIKIKNIKRGSI